MPANDTEQPIANRRVAPTRGAPTRAASSLGVPTRAGALRTRSRSAKEPTASVFAACDDEMVALGPKIVEMSLEGLARLGTKELGFHKGGVKARLLDLEIPHHRLRELTVSLLDIYWDLYLQNLPKIKIHELASVPDYYTTNYSEKFIPILDKLSLDDLAELPENLTTLVSNNIIEKLENCNPDDLKKYGKLLYLLSNEKLMSLDDQTLSRLAPSRLVQLPRQLTWTILISAVGGDASVYRATLTHAHAISGLHEKLIEQRTRFPLLLNYDAAFKLMGLALVKPVSAGLKVKMQRLCEMFDGNEIFPVANKISLKQYERLKHHLVNLALYLNAMSKEQILKVEKAGYQANEWFRLENFPRDIEDMCFPNGITANEAKVKRQQYSELWQSLEGVDKTLVGDIKKEKTVLRKQEEHVNNGKPGLVVSLNRFTTLAKFIESFMLENKQRLSTSQADIDAVAAIAVETLHNLFATATSTFPAVTEELQQHKIIPEVDVSPFAKKEAPQNIFLSDYQVEVLKFILLQQFELLTSNPERKVSPDKRNSDEVPKLVKGPKEWKKILEPVFEHWMSFHNQLTMIRQDENSELMLKISRYADQLLLQLNDEKFSKAAVIDFLLALKIHSDQLVGEKQYTEIVKGQEIVKTKSVKVPSFRLQDDFMTAYLAMKDNSSQSILAELMALGLSKAIDPTHHERLCRVTNEYGIIKRLMARFRSWNPLLKCTDEQLRKIALQVYQTMQRSMKLQVASSHYCNPDYHFDHINQAFTQAALNSMLVEYSKQIDPTSGIQRQLENGFRAKNKASGKKGLDTGDYSLPDLIDAGYNQIVQKFVNQADRNDLEKIAEALKGVNLDDIQEAVNGMSALASRRANGSVGFFDSLAEADDAQTVKPFEDVRAYSTVSDQFDVSPQPSPRDGAGSTAGFLAFLDSDDIAQATIESMAGNIVSSTTTIKPVALRRTSSISRAGKALLGRKKSPSQPPAAEKPAPASTPSFNPSTSFQRTEKSSAKARKHGSLIGCRVAVPALEPEDSGKKVIGLTDALRTGRPG